MLSKLPFQRLFSLSRVPKKCFDLHEYQSKKLMANFGIKVQKGDIALNAKDAAKVAASLDSTGGLVLKCQVHAGGRGKGNRK